jgi:hypothetical protein
MIDLTSSLGWIRVFRGERFTVGNPHQSRSQESGRGVAMLRYGTVSTIEEEELSTRIISTESSGDATSVWIRTDYVVEKHQGPSHWYFLTGLKTALLLSFN